MSLTTLLSMTDRQSEISANVLLEDFFKYVNVCERAILKALDLFSTLTTKEKEILSNIFTSYRFYEIRKENEIRKQVLSIAFYQNQNSSWIL